MESRLTEEERALVTDATRKLLSVVDCFDPVACDSAMSNIMLVVSSIADARIAELVGLLQLLLDSGVLDGVEIDDVDPKIAIRAALENNRGGK